MGLDPSAVSDFFTRLVDDNHSSNHSNHHHGDGNNNGNGNNEAGMQLVARSLSGGSQQTHTAY